MTGSMRLAASATFTSAVLTRSTTETHHPDSLQKVHHDT